MFSEPKLVIPGASLNEPAGGGDGVETQSSGEQLPEAKSTAVAGSPTAQPDGRQPKRARDIAEVADCNTVGSTRKKRKGNRKSG